MGHSTVERKIIHVDMDAFYASVEQRDHPELRGKPICVGGSPSGRGVVTSPSYEARAFGVRSAMPAHRALRLCPEAIFVRPRFQEYVAVSKRLRKIFSEVTDKVEPLSLDEAYLDVTENKLGEPSATRLAGYLRARIRGQLQLNASAGVGPNKFIAKVASAQCKPNGLLVIAPGEVAAFVEALPVEKLWGVGPKTAQKLHRMGLPTTREIRQRPLVDLQRSLGKWAHQLKGLAEGRDHREVSPYRERKSVGAENTFPRDLTDAKEMHARLFELAQRIEERLAKKELAGLTLTLKVRYHDFNTHTRATTGRRPLNRADEIFDAAWKLLDAPRLTGPVRLLGLSVKNFPLEQNQLAFDLDTTESRKQIPKEDFLE